MVVDYQETVEYRISKRLFHDILALILFYKI